MIGFLRKGVVVWAMAVVVTLTLAVFQRMTGPTHPRRGSVSVEGRRIDYRLLRSHGGGGGLPVSLDVKGLSDASAVLRWRLYPGEHPWHELSMERQEGHLVAVVPHQPPAGKVEYRIVLRSGSSTVQVPGDEPVVARFKGAVPAGILVPHILCMFLSMLLATVAFVRVAVGGPPPRVEVLLGMLFLMAGGLVLGPMVQYHAFGAYWTGWPYGTDLTDNKTAIAFLAWLPVTILALRRRRMTLAVLVGWVVMMGVFLIPHSLRGSHIDWEKEAAGKKTAAKSAGELGRAGAGERGSRGEGEANADSPEPGSGGGPTEDHPAHR